jgi:hypothetical protein
MNHYIRRFDEPTVHDSIRVFPETWREHAWLKNVRSAYGLIVVGLPTKQIEFLSLGTHRIHCR